MTFTEGVSGVDPSDFTLTFGGTVTAMAPVAVTPDSTSIYTVTVSGITGTGTLGLNLLDNGSIRDANGNGLVQSDPTAALQTQDTFAAGSVDALGFTAAGTAAGVWTQTADSTVGIGK